MYFKSIVYFVTVIISFVTAHISESTPKNSDTNFNTMLSDLEHYKPVEILNGLSVQVEKTQIPAPASSDETTSSNQHLSEQGRASFFSPASYLSSHALKLDFGLMKLRFGRSDEDPDKMELALFMPEEVDGRARDRKSAKIMLPMILGFKAASTLIVAIASVALLTFKALLAAKIALLVTGALALKKLVESKPVVKSSGQHSQGYLMSNYNLDISDAAAAYHGTTGYDAYANYGLSGQEAASSDLNGQFSSGQAAFDTVAQNTSVTAAAVAAAAKRRDNLRRRPFVAKQHPVYNYRKALRT